MLHPSLFGYWLQSRGEAMPRPYPATPRVAHRPEAQLRAGAKKPRADEGGTPEGRGPGWPEFTSPVSGGVAMYDRGRGMASPLRKPLRLPG